MNTTTATTESREIFAPGADAALAGTLLLPISSTPPHDTVLILPGSGPVERGGNSPVGLTTDA